MGRRLVHSPTQFFTRTNKIRIMTAEEKKEITEKADNYALGRAMALSFKPLTIEDVKDAFLNGAEEMEHLIQERE